MSLREELSERVEETFKWQWKTRHGTKVPKDDDVGLFNDAVELEGTVLYADLANSTTMVREKSDQFAAEVYKTYLYCASRLIRDFEGTITAYDGDRVMAVFIGNSKNSNAATCALKINYAVTKIINPAIAEQYGTGKYTLKQRVGIDSSDLFVARTGIRGSNDLVWVGDAANNAAKMASLDTTYSSYITEDVHDRLNRDSKYDGGTSLWTDLGNRELGYRIYGSNYHWGF